MVHGGHDDHERGAPAAPRPARRIRPEQPGHHRGRDGRERAGAGSRGRCGGRRARGRAVRLPVPLVQPLFPGGTEAVTADGTAASSGSAGGAGREAPPQAGAVPGVVPQRHRHRLGRGPPGRSAAGRQAAERARSRPGASPRTRPRGRPRGRCGARAARPATAGPSALAGSQPAYLALPPAGPGSYGRTLRRPLLPLGVGLALIGAGAGLLGWRLRRL
ncbi:hypothetical protein GXW82_34060 [Streptacidiphilus sp. 4-A2]|nr:hypothetical protein [Streptacidiphilus sp. 4-A2]